mmetsp:Transcript_50805/g.94455  ORF Transcript_50805/g.94455 Transcript_50805/m.94455 type:complete len:300 (-) Transcript_50805:67-966(-)
MDRLGPLTSPTRSALLLADRQRARPATADDEGGTGDASSGHLFSSAHLSSPSEAVPTLLPLPLLPLLPLLPQPSTSTLDELAPSSSFPSPRLSFPSLAPPPPRPSSSATPPRAATPWHKETHAPVPARRSRAGADGAPIACASSYARASPCVAMRLELNLTTAHRSPSSPLLRKNTKKSSPPLFTSMSRPLDFLSRSPTKASDSTTATTFQVTTASSSPLSWSVVTSRGSAARSRSRGARPDGDVTTVSGVCDLLSRQVCSKACSCSSMAAGHTCSSLHNSCCPSSVIIRASAIKSPAS